MRSLFKNSWNILLKKPVLMVPDLIFLIIGAILGYSLLNISGILEIFNPLMAGEISDEVIKTFFTDNFVKLIISFSIFIITTFLFGASLVSFKYHLLKKATENSRIYFIKDFKESQKNNLWKVIGMKIIEFVIIVIGSAIIGALLTLVNYFTNNELGSLIMSILILTVSIIFALIFKLALLYRYPVLFYTNTSVWKAIKESALIFKKNKKRVFLVFLILFGVNLSFAIIELTGNSLVNITKNIAVLSTTIFFIIVGIKAILSIVQSTWADLFIFVTYKSKK